MLRVYPHWSSASTLAKDPIDLYCAKHTKRQTVTFAMTLKNRFQERQRYRCRWSSVCVHSSTAWPSVTAMSLSLTNSHFTMNLFMACWQWVAINGYFHNSRQQECIQVGWYHPLVTVWGVSWTEIPRTETPYPLERPPSLDRDSPYREPPRQRHPLDRDPPGQRPPPDIDPTETPPLDREPPPRTETETPPCGQTPLKTLPSSNFVCGR